MKRIFVRLRRNTLQRTVAIAALARRRLVEAKRTCPPESWRTSRQIGAAGMISLRQRLLLDRDGDRRPRRTPQGAPPRPTPKAMADGVRSSPCCGGWKAGLASA
ncbi:MAG TPA: hypothetical protein VMW89_18115 [Desulfatiglandales bacterium]|nr:hypothetical protein [Desulfatiglandales bacterium]